MRRALRDSFRPFSQCRGDAHFIQLPSGALTLIDGGDAAPDKAEDSPLHWMKRQRVDTLDWMIQTHLHEDHLLGLIEAANAKQVIGAILPYKPFNLPAKEAFDHAQDEATTKVYRLLAAYLELVDLLMKKGTEIIWRNGFHSAETSVVWSQEGFTLHHLYPWQNDSLPAWSTLENALHDYTSGSADWLVLFQQFFDLSNYDSSVYRLTYDGGKEEDAIGALQGGINVVLCW